MTKGLHVLLQEERERSTRYFDRMTRVEGNLADIRTLLGVSNRPNRATLQRIEDIQTMAAKWVRHMDSITGGRELIGWDG